MSTYITQTESEQSFKLYQQARREAVQRESKRKGWSSPRAVISEEYGSNVETFLRRNTL